MTAVAKGCPGFIEPESDVWRRTITPSKVPAILGLSRWESPFRLWHRMKGLVPPDPPKDAFDLGHDMESYAAARWRRRNLGWSTSVGEVQFHVPDGHYDFPAIATIDRRASRGSWRRIVEVKIARNQTDLETWGDDLTGDCPEDYAAQVTAQRMFVAASQPTAKWLPMSHLLAIGPYFNERIYEIEYLPRVAAWMIGECTQFYDSLAGTKPPPLDDTVATYECLRAVHSDIDPGSTVNLDPALAAAFLAVKADEKAFQKQLQGVKNRVAAAMGSAQYGVVGTITVARRQPGKGGVSLYAVPGATPDDIRHMEGSNT